MFPTVAPHPIIGSGDPTKTGPSKCCFGFPNYDYVGLCAEGGSGGANKTGGVLPGCTSSLMMGIFEGWEPLLWSSDEGHHVQFGFAYLDFVVLFGIFVECSIAHSSSPLSLVHLVMLGFMVGATTPMWAVYVWLTTIEIDGRDGIRLQVFNQLRLRTLWSWCFRARPGNAKEVPCSGAMGGSQRSATLRVSYIHDQKMTGTGRGGAYLNRGCPFGEVPGELPGDDLPGLPFLATLAPSSPCLASEYDPSRSL